MKKFHYRLTNLVAEYSITKTQKLKTTTTQPRKKHIRFEYAWRIDIKYLNYKKDRFSKRGMNSPHYVPLTNIRLLMFLFISRHFNPMNTSNMPALHEALVLR